MLSLIIIYNNGIPTESKSNKTDALFRQITYFKQLNNKSKFKSIYLKSAFKF